MPRFNIALLPRNEIWQGHFAGIAQTRFGAYQDGYLLGPNALAHITLCQFEASEDAARQAFASLGDKRDENIILEKFSLRGGTGENSGTHWAQFNVRATPSLIARQAAVFDHLAARELTIYTPKETYAPHLTMARLRRIIDYDVGAPFAEEKIAMRPALGVSTLTGVFTREFL